MTECALHGAEDHPGCHGCWMANHSSAHVRTDTEPRDYLAAADAIAAGDDDQYDCPGSTAYALLRPQYVALRAEVERLRGVVKIAQEWFDKTTSIREPVPPLADALALLGERP